MKVHPSTSLFSRNLPPKCTPSYITKNQSTATPENSRVKIRELVIIITSYQLKYIQRRVLTFVVGDSDSPFAHKRSRLYRTFIHPTTHAKQRRPMETIGKGHGVYSHASSNHKIPI
jgi:hypothetical protein